MIQDKKELNSYHFLRVDEYSAFVCVRYVCRSRQSLFLWIVAVINTSLGKGEDSLPFIGVLDIFGEVIGGHRTRTRRVISRPDGTREVMVVCTGGSAHHTLTPFPKLSQSLLSGYTFEPHFR